MSHSADPIAYHTLTLGLYKNLCEAEGQWFIRSLRLERVLNLSLHRLDCFWGHLIHQNMCTCYPCLSASPFVNHGKAVGFRDSRPVGHWKYNWNTQNYTHLIFAKKLRCFWKENIHCRSGEMIIPCSVFSRPPTATVVTVSSCFFRKQHSRSMLSICRWGNLVCLRKLGSPKVQNPTFGLLLTKQSSLFCPVTLYFRNILFLASVFFSFLQNI